MITFFSLDCRAQRDDQLIDKTFDCSGFYEESCDTAKPKPGFEKDGQSRSAALETGQPSDLNIIVHAGHVYHLTLCKGKFRKPLRCRIKTREGEVLYDNKDHEMSPFFEFTARETQHLKVEVTAPGERVEVGEIRTTDMSCVGVLIRHKPAPKSGFEN